MTKSKLKAKDIIMITLLSMINLIIFSLSSFLYILPITVLFTPVFFALTQGVVVFVIGYKVHKRGAFLLYCVIQSIFGGYLPYLFAYLASGIIGELILAKTGYGSSKGLTLSYIIMQILICIGSTVYPYVFAISKTLEMKSMRETGISDVTEKAGRLINSWGMLVFIAVVIVSAYIGALFGKKVVEKHFNKSREEMTDNG